MNFNFKKLPPFKWFVLQNFPFIEADFDAITYYQLLCKLAEELNKIITQNNQIGVQVENLTIAYNQLQEYITNYFDNLDVQEEINNKLDEMVESGEFEELLNEIITKSQPNKIVFMPIANLPESSIANIAGGDCTLIQTGTGKNILIDTGFTLSYDVIKQELIKNNVSKIDYIIISHYHPDHVGNIQNLFSDFDLTQTIFYLCKHTSNFTFPEETLLLTLAVNNEKIYPNTGDIVTIDDLKIEFFNCSQSDIDYYEENSTDYNDYSMCCYVECENKRFAFVGDIMPLAQERIYNQGYCKKSDVLKVEHHGYNQGVFDDYILSIKPELAIINEYINALSIKSTLDNDTLALLNSFCQNIYCTGNGAVYVHFNKYFLTYDKNSYNIGASYPAEWKYFDIYVDNTYTGISDGTSNKPFKNLIEAIAYVNTLRNINVNIICNNGYVSDERLKIVNNNSLKITNVSINSIYCNNAVITLDNVTFTNNTKGELSLYALNSKLNLTNITINQTKQDSNIFNARGITIVNSEITMNNITIENHSLGMAINNNSKVFINNFTCNNTNTAVAIDDNSLVTIKSITGSYTNMYYKYLNNIDYISMNDYYQPIKNITDLNQLEAYYWLTPVKYFIDNTSLSNLPEQAYGWLTSYYQSANTQVQTFLSNSGRFYTRRKAGGTWQSWSEK